MVSSTPSLTRLKRRLQGLAALCCVLVCLRTACAEGIVIKSAELLPQDNALILNITFDVSLGHVLEDALTRGVPLNFVTEFELQYPRWYFLNLWNRDVAAHRSQQKLSYNLLSRQYRLSAGGLHQTFDTLDEVLAVLGRTRNRPVAPREAAPAGEVYIAGVRMWLDTSQLPKPLQINALGSRDWNLSSDWYRWTFKQ
jgi:Domain of unknown function (DUF4390)